jgi:hypothetical protein
LQSLTTVENGDTFTTIDPENPEIKRYGKFTETEMIMVSQRPGARFFVEQSSTIECTRQPPPLQKIRKQI